MAHGSAIYHEVMVNFCAKHIQSDNLVMMNKEDEEASITLFKRANNMFTDLLIKNVRNFSRDSIVKIQSAEVNFAEAQNHHAGPRLISTIDLASRRMMHNMTVANQAAAVNESQGSRAKSESRRGGILNSCLLRNVSFGAQENGDDSAEENR